MTLGCAVLGIAPLDISRAPGVELLSPQEQGLCSCLRLLPAQYLAIKDALVRESLRLGYLSRDTARRLVQIGRC